MTFAGWALTPDGEVVYSNKEKVTNITGETYSEKITLYAIWQ